MTFLKILCRNNRPLGNTGRQKLGYFTTMKYFGFMLLTSVRQTNSALSNLSLNIQGDVEVPKSNFFLKKIMSVSCNQPLYVKI